MFGPPARLYVYTSYGIHLCANVVCEAPGSGAAVLLRAVQPVQGIERMRSLRGLAANSSARQIASGPGKLTQALGVTLDHYGADLTHGPLTIHEPAQPKSFRIQQTERVGITRSAELPLRFFIRDNRHVSRAR